MRRPPAGTSLSEPPGLIWTNFSPMSPFVLIETIASVWSFTASSIRRATRAWYSLSPIDCTRPTETPAISTAAPDLSPPTVGKSA